MISLAQQETTASNIQEQKKTPPAKSTLKRETQSSGQAKSLSTSSRNQTSEKKLITPRSSTQPTQKDKEKSVPPAKTVPSLGTQGRNLERFKSPITSGSQNRALVKKSLVNSKKEEDTIKSAKKFGNN